MFKFSLRLRLGTLEEKRLLLPFAEYGLGETRAKFVEGYKLGCALAGALDMSARERDVSIESFLSVRMGPVDDRLT